MTMPAVHERAQRLRAERVPFVHARVVLAERPTSSKPGDEAIVLADGTIEGFVGGHCAQATVRAEGLAALQRGSSVLLRIAPEPEPDQVGKTVVHNPCLSGGTLEIFMEPVLPAPLVRVVGTSPTAQALVTVGESLGYAISAGVDGDAEPVDAVVVASHGIDEEPALRSALDAGVPYIALVASPKRGTAVLAGMGLSDEERARIHTPAGLNIGARTPAEVALSIYAELIEERQSESAPAASLGVFTIVEPEVAVDPVCQMSVAAVESSIYADVAGERFYFCCPGCRERFVADPAGFGHG
jgi:xanthine dehydrogenase accessory factor